VPPGLNLDWPRAWGEPVAQCLLRAQPEDFEVEEQLGFVPEGEGEHVFLLVEKRGLNTMDVARKLAHCAGIEMRELGYAGLKDKHALTRQWFSLGLAGRAEPDWTAVENQQLRILTRSRHRRKLRRGAHRGNQFRLTLRELSGDLELLTERLQKVRELGAPNYFGEQRFGFGGGNLDAGLSWLRGQSRKPQRHLRGIYLSALRSFLFNRLLAERVKNGQWQSPDAGDICILSGSNSFFTAEPSDHSIAARAAAGDLHLGLPLWGVGEVTCSQSLWQEQLDCLAEYDEICQFMLRQNMKLDWRAARLLPDDFCYQFCDDGTLVLEFSLVTGGYATALLREFVSYKDKGAND
jgi:tRNA pseudouridine13 synthase